MNKKPNLRMRKYTAPELPLLALLCGVATLTSSLFAVTAVPVTSDASECLIEINDDVLGDMDTNVTLSATGGTATVNDLSSSGADADASACAIAIDGDVVQNSPVAPILSATFDLTALGGAADASSFGDATSDTSAFVSGVDFIEGDFMGSITGEATGGDAEAYGGFYSDAYANADAYGNRGFSGDSTGSVDVTARGGIATAGRSFSNSIFLDEVESEVIEDSDSEYSYADASATAIASGGSKKKSRDLADSIEAAAPIEQFQAISGSYSASAFGGDSEANGIFSAIANSRASADGIVIDEIFQGEIDAEISAIAEGGDANAVSEEGSVLADASADAVGIRFDEGFIMFPEDEIESNLWQETDLIEGGEIQGGGILIPESTYNVYAQAIAINGTTFSDEISGALNATAVGGTAIFQQGGLVGDTIESVGFDYDTYGFVIGQEKLVGDQLIVGIAGSYAQTDVNGNNGSGGGDTDLYSGVVYGNWFTDTWYTEVGLTYGHAQTDTRRKDIANVTYTGDYDSNLYGTWVEVGYTTTYAGFEAEPFARVSYVYGDHEGFTDSGAGPNTLTTKDTDTNNFKTELGLRLTEEWVFENKSKFLLGVKAAWQHEWADRNVSLVSPNFQSPRQFMLRGLFRAQI